MKLLSVARDLKRRKARERQQRFVAEGIRTVEALLDSPLMVYGLLTAAALRDDTRGAALVARAEARGLPVLEVADAEFASAADTEAPQGVLAIGGIPDRVLAPPGPAGCRLLILDALQDPGNVGTIIRSGAALGVTATVALPGTVDLWNAKVVRSTMGALFAHPALPMTWEAVLAFCQEHAVSVWAADSLGTPVEALTASSLPDRLALAVSNEGAGLSPAVAASLAARVAIRMSPGVESLNVAVATGILLHTLRPR